MSSNLASKLRVGTKKAHTMAENVGFVKCFLKGVVEKKTPTASWLLTFTLFTQPWKRRWKNTNITQC
jgi:heme oxygenase